MSTQTKRQATSTIKDTRAYDLLYRFRHAILGHYAQAKREKLPQSSVSKSVIRDVYLHPLFKRLPQFMRRELQTADLSMSEFIIATDCTFAYFLDGQVIPGKGLVGGPHWQRFREYEEQHGPVPSGFVWVGTEVWYTDPAPLG